MPMSGAAKAVDAVAIVNLAGSFDLPRHSETGPGVEIGRLSAKRTERAEQLAILAILCTTWAIAWWVRHNFASPNVDDYLYTMERADLGAARGRAHRWRRQFRRHHWAIRAAFFRLSASAVAVWPRRRCPFLFPLLLALSLLCTALSAGIVLPAWH